MEFSHNLFYQLLPDTEAMKAERKFQKMQLIASGGMSFIYLVDPNIVVKVPKNDEESRQQFCKEIETYKVLSRQGPCAFIVQCFYFTNEGIFLEYMRGKYTQNPGFEIFIHTE